MFVDVVAPGLMSSTSTQGKPSPIPHDKNLFDAWAVSALAALRAEQLAASWADAISTQEGAE
jgi:hypothetical protein